VSAVVRALLDELGPDDLAALAERLRPYLVAEDGWLGTKEAAAYAGCSVHSLRHAVARGEVEFEQACPGGKTWFRRSALDRWRQAT
jgi:excisionase family DNA binding protein